MAAQEPFTSLRLLCPGPTPVPDEVRAALTETSIYHRSDDFCSIFIGCMAALKPIFGSDNDPLILTSSGSGAMEAAVTNLTAPGDKVVVVNAGKFGERWQKLNEAYGCDTTTVKIDWGSAPKIEQIAEAVGRPGVKALFLQANETSTGVKIPVDQLIPELRKTFNGLVVVDAISSLGAHPMRMSEWGIDCVVAGSQKGFGLPPGLAFIALSDRAYDSLSKRPRFYFDLARERKGQAEGKSAWTPASSLIMGLTSALGMIHGMGVDQWIAHHRRLANGTRAAVKAMGLSLYPKEFPSDAVTAIAMPAGVDGSKVVKRVKQRFNAYLAGGQDELKGKIVRLAHLGSVSVLDMISAIAAVEISLADCGARISVGDGVKAAMQSFHQSPADSNRT